MLDHYTAAGLVDVTPLTLPDYQPNTAGLQHLYMEERRRTTQLLQFELISLNDCLYRNMYRYKGCSDLGYVFSLESHKWHHYDVISANFR